MSPGGSGRGLWGQTTQGVLGCYFKCCSALASYCCVASDPEISSLKQNSYWISQSLWVRNPGRPSLGPPPQRLSQSAGKTSARRRISVLDREGPAACSRDCCPDAAPRRPSSGFQARASAVWQLASSKHTHQTGQGEGVTATQKSSSFVT